MTPIPQYQPIPMPEMPPGSVPGKGRTYLEAGIGAFTVLFCLFYFFIFGYMLYLGVLNIYIATTGLYGAILVGISLGFLLPVVFLLPNKSGVYENGIRVSRPLILRALGQPSFFRWEDILAVYPAVTSAGNQEADPSPNWYHPMGDNWTRFGEGPAPFGQGLQKLMSDTEVRNGLAVETSEGRFILTLCVLGDRRSPYYQMLPFVKYAMGMRGLPLVRKRFALPDDEMAETFYKSGPLESKWFYILMGCSLGIPALFLLIANGILFSFVPTLSDWNVPLIIIAVVLGTCIFVFIYQYKVVQNNEAKNRLYYHYASVPPEKEVVTEEPVEPVSKGPTEKVWDPSQE